MEKVPWDFSRVWKVLPKRGIFKPRKAQKKGRQNLRVPGQEKKPKGKEKEGGLELGFFVLLAKKETKKVGEEKPGQKRVRKIKEGEILFPGGLIKILEVLGRSFGQFKGN